MNREEKAAVVEEIAAQIEGADTIFAIDYRGISVPEAAELRSRLREADASFRVVKNRLTKLAADKAGQDELKDLLEGPTALTFVSGDMATAAKAISTFSREHEVLVFKGGFMDGSSIDEEQFTSIARLPALDVLHGQFAGMVASPLTGLVRGLNAMISGLAIQLQQIAEQGLVSAEAPAETPPGEETPVEETPAEEEAPAEDAPAEEAPAETAEEPAPAEEQPEAAAEEGPAEDDGAEQAEAQAEPEQTSDDDSSDEEE